MRAVDANTTGASNVARGQDALGANTTASNNIAVGLDALRTNTTGASNTAVGYQALDANTTGQFNTDIGGKQTLGALGANTSGGFNTAVGVDALGSNTTAGENTAIGYQAMYANTTGLGNSAIGTTSLSANTTGNDNTAVGFLALQDVTTGSTNVAVGTYAGRNITTGTDNVAIGRHALSDLQTGGQNVAIGDQCLYNTTGSQNVAVGDLAGHFNETGENNAFLGRFAGYNTTTNNNTFIGGNAGYLISTGSDNTILGRYNGNQYGIDIRALSNRIVLSDGDGNPRLIINNTGYTQMSPSLSSADRYNSTSHLMHSTSGDITAFIENSHASSPYGLLIDFSGASPNTDNNYFLNCFDSTTNRLLIWSNGDVENQNNSYTGFSDEKLKEQIKDASSQWEDIKALRVRNFKFKTDVATGDSDSHWRLGVIAQEVETAGMYGLVKNTTDRDRNNNDLGTTTKKVKYSILYMKAVKALQEAMERIETLEAKVTALENG